MSIFDYETRDAIGVVDSVDTGSVVVRVENAEQLKGLQVNQLVVLRSTRVAQHLVGIVTKIMRKACLEPLDPDSGTDGLLVENIIKITLIGTHIDKVGGRHNVFKRTLESVPELGSECFVLTGEKLTEFMKSISQLSASSGTPLSLGKYTLDEEAEAWLDGNKLFQRHAIIVGSTGCGKSWSVARLLEQIANLPSSNAVVFDIHGEYKPLKAGGFSHLTVAGPGDKSASGALFLPYWLLTYEEMVSLLLDRTDSNAPNQAMTFSNAVINAKKKSIEAAKRADLLGNYTVDSPIPFDIQDVFDELNGLDNERVEGARSDKAGPMNGKLTRFLQRLEAKRNDRRLNFLFNYTGELCKFEYMVNTCKALMAGKSKNSGCGIKVIDFSEVPSDILPLIIGLVARVIFSVQQWMTTDQRHPISLFCDEAHLYIPETAKSVIDESALYNFERIAKEGRKYGVGLVVISQRPAEVSRTILSQSSNFIAMRLSNAEDQAVVRRLLPDSLGDFAELLPVLDVGEALVVGDASLLPSRIKVAEPKEKPNSATVDFWAEWMKKDCPDSVGVAVEALRRQAK